jgi:hypothetical protein
MTPFEKKVVITLIQICSYLFKRNGYVSLSKKRF